MSYCNNKVQVYLPFKPVEETGPEACQHAHRHREDSRFRGQGDGGTTTQQHQLTHATGSPSTQGSSKRTTMDRKQESVL